METLLLEELVLFLSEELGGVEARVRGAEAPRVVRGDRSIRTLWTKSSRLS